MTKIIRMCKNCDHWVPLTPGAEGAAGGSCPIKNRLTSWMSLCEKFESKILALHADHQIVECVEKPGYIRELTRGKTYVVNGTTQSHGWTYYTILGDDGRSHSFLSSMFRALTSH